MNPNYAVNQTIESIKYCLSQFSLVPRFPNRSLAPRNYVPDNNYESTLDISTNLKYWDELFKGNFNIPAEVRQYRTYMKNHIQELKSQINLTFSFSQILSPKNT